MPTYEYECEACGHTFEEFQQINDSPLKVCPKCRKRRLRRLLGAGAAVLFKGSGFYQTDYRSKDYHEKAKSEKTASEPPCSSCDKSKSCSAKKKD